MAMYSIIVKCAIHDDIASEMFTFLTSREVCDLIVELSTVYGFLPLYKNDKFWIDLAYHHFNGDLKTSNNPKRRQCLPVGVCSSLQRYYEVNRLCKTMDIQIQIVHGNVETIQEDLENAIEVLAFPVPAFLMNSTVGVQGIVHRMAGHELGTELETYISRYGSLGISKAITTSGFHSPFPYLIHANGPSKNTPHRQYHLYHTYENIMKQFIELKSKNIHHLGIISISTGLLKYPIYEAALICMLCIRNTIQRGDWDSNNVLTIICFDSSVQDPMENAKEEMINNFLYDYDF